MAEGAAVAIRRRLWGLAALACVALAGVAALAASAPSSASPFGGGGDFGARVGFAAQPAFFALFGVAVGGLLASATGLRSSIVDGAAAVRPGDLRRGALFVALAAVYGGALPIAAHILAQTESAAAGAFAPDARVDIGGALAGLAYGALTEEAVYRWGAVAAIAWSISGLAPSGVARVFGVVVAALLYAALQLPALILAAPDASAALVVFVVADKLILGLLLGAAFVSARLESAMAAHAAQQLATLAASLLLVGVRLG